eukprot:m.125532 g.125532  ORF g.125532 m.125532 type:complete len:502 (-) comp13546_c0_seq3:84-1589(-)
MDQDDLLVVVIAGCVVSAVLIAVALVVHCKVWSLESKANDLNTKYEFEMKERLLREAHLPPKKAYYPVAVAPMPPPQQLQLHLQQSPPVERDPVAESDRMWVELRALEQRQEAAEAARHRALKSAYAAKLASQSLGEHVEPRAKQLVTGTSTSAVEPQRRSESPVQTYIPRVPNEALRRALLPPVPTRPPAPSAPPATTPPTTRRSHTPSLPTVPVPQPPPPPPPTSLISAIADLTAPPLPVTTPPPPPAPPAAPTPPPQPDANAFFGGSGGGALADLVDYSDDEDASASTPAPTQRTSSMKNQQMLEKMHTYFDKDTKGELEHSSSFVLHSAARKWQDKAAKRAGSHPTPAPTAMKEIQDLRAVNMVSDVQNPIKEQDNVLVQAKQVEERMERERRAVEEQAAAEVEAKEAALAAARKKKEDEERAAEQAAKRAVSSRRNDAFLFSPVSPGRLTHSCDHLPLLSLSSPSLLHPNPPLMRNPHPNYSCTKFQRPPAAYEVM